MNLRGHKKVQCNQEHIAQGEMKNNLENDCFLQNTLYPLAPINLTTNLKNKFYFSNFSDCKIV